MKSNKAASKPNHCGVFLAFLKAVQVGGRCCQPRVYCWQLRKRNPARSILSAQVLSHAPVNRCVEIARQGVSVNLHQSTSLQQFCVLPEKKQAGMDPLSELPSLRRMRHPHLGVTPPQLPASVEQLHFTEEQLAWLTGRFPGAFGTTQSAHLRDLRDQVEATPTPLQL